MAGGKHLVIWPKVRVTVKDKRRTLAKGDMVPAGVSDAELANLVSFGAIAGASGGGEEEDQKVAVPSTPTKGSSKADWVAYATDEARGEDRLSDEEAEELTRDQLAAMYLEQS
jgi:hypothetical protein